MIFRPTTCLAALFLLGLNAPAHADVIVHKDLVGALTQTNIRAFLEEVEQIANGAQPGMTPDKMTAYFSDHLADDGHFETTLHYELPGKPAQDSVLSYDKPQYIDKVASSLGSMQGYSSALDIQQIDIAPDGKSARLKTVTKEQGKLVFPVNAKGEAQLVSTSGETACDQVLVISNSNYIQMKTAECKTSMTLDPGTTVIGQ